jgi:hypothetical protein
MIAFLDATTAAVSVRTIGAERAPLVVPRTSKSSRGGNKPVRGDIQVYRDGNVLVREDNESHRETN